MISYLSFAYALFPDLQDSPFWGVVLQEISWVNNFPDEFGSIIEKFSPVEARLVDAGPASEVVSIVFDAAFADKAVIFSKGDLCAEVSSGGPYWAGLRCLPALPAKGRWTARFVIGTQATDGPGTMVGLCSGEHHPLSRRAFGSAHGWMFCCKTGWRWHSGKSSAFTAVAAVEGKVMVSPRSVIFLTNLWQCVW